jgi:hypothetical protein
MRDGLRQISVVIYRLKRKFGKRIIIRQITEESQDVTTGVLSQIENDLVIPRAVLLPNKIKRDFAYDLSYVAANKNFTYGATFVSGQRNLLIDSKDVPSDFIFTIKDSIIYNERRCEIVDIQDLEYAYLVKIKDVAATEAIEDVH